DAGFTAQKTIPDNVFAELTNVANPRPNLKLNFVDPLYRRPTPEPPKPVDNRIDIRRSVIVDSQTNEVAPLDSFIRAIREGDIVLDTKALHSDEEDRDAEFDFKFDEETSKYGAGTVFLKDDV